MDDPADMSSKGLEGQAPPIASWNGGIREASMKDTLDAAPDVEAAQPLPLDPFGARPGWASLIEGLGGLEPAPDPSYVFLTLDCRPALGPVRVVIHFAGLRATRGTLLFEIRARSAVHSAEHARLDTVVVDAQQLVDCGGIVELRFESFRNTYYAIACSINDETDLVASQISVTLDRRATAEQHGTAWERASDHPPAGCKPGIGDALIDRVLTDLANPSLDRPMSQIATPQQCRERAFMDAMGELRRQSSPSHLNWSYAFLLQAFKRYVGEERSRILIFGKDFGPLLSYFAGQNCDVVGLEHSDMKNRMDPGAALQALWVPDLCSEKRFFERAHFSYGDIRAHISEFRDQFDVILSMNADRLMLKSEYVYFVVNGLSHLRPGGMAVHIFDCMLRPEDDNGANLSRQDVERMTALALSHKNDVARLKFRQGGRIPDQAIPLPFGLVLLRGGYRDRDGSEA